VLDIIGGSQGESGCTAPQCQCSVLVRMGKALDLGGNTQPGWRCRARCVMEIALQTCRSQEPPGMGSGDHTV